MDLIDGQPTGSVRISFGYMSTLEDAQAFLRFIIATQLCPSGGEPISQATPKEAGAPPAVSEAQNTMTATMDGSSSSPEEDTRPDSRVWNDLPTAVDAVSLNPPVLEATRILQTPSGRAAGVLDGGLGPHVVTSLYLYPIKSCAAFEVRVLMAAWRLLLFCLLYNVFFFFDKVEKVQ